MVTVRIQIIYNTHTYYTTLFQHEWNAIDPAGPGPSEIYTYNTQYERDEVDNNNMFYTSVPRNNRESESHVNDRVVLCGDRNLFPSRPPPQLFLPHRHARGVHK